MSDRHERIDINSDELSAFERFCNKAINPGLYPSEVIMLANRSLMVASAYREKCAEVGRLQYALRRARDPNGPKWRREVIDTVLAETGGSNDA